MPVVMDALVSLTYPLVSLTECHPPPLLQEFLV